MPNTLPSSHKLPVKQNRISFTCSSYETNVDMSHGQSDKQWAPSLSQPLLGHIHARLKPHPHSGRLRVNDKHRIEPKGPWSPDAHHPVLFMFENVLEEKCENAFSEHGGPARLPGCQQSHTIGAMRIGRIGLGTAAPGDGWGRIGLSLRFLPGCCKKPPQLYSPTWSSCGPSPSAPQLV